jgi:Protein of unknown function (DUF3048) N-terminal domain/Protein of unknown function (DUF3048) C-terminal domain
MRVPPGARRVTVIFAAWAALALVSGCGHPKAAAISTTTTPTTTTVPTTTTARPVPVCPLTGTAAPAGVIPPRAAIAVKVENLAAARPQWGLDDADIVFEEPVEGGVTRFIAVYQCHMASRIEPVRSARFVDASILEPLGKILFGSSGGIQPVVNQIDSPASLLEDVGIGKAPAAYSSDPTRVPPHDLQTSTAALYKAAKSLEYPVKNVPPAYFKYGSLPAGGKPANSVHIDFPLDVTNWDWDPTAGRWLRSYSDTGPAVQGDNAQISAANVVVLHVVEYPTPYLEDATGAREEQLQLTGTGPAWIFRNGVEFKGTWKRPSLTESATFMEGNGTEITLTPGNTWEELVPTVSPVSVSGLTGPGGGAPGKASGGPPGAA